MVGGKPPLPQREPYAPSSTRADNLLGCSKDRWLGGSVPPGFYGGSVEGRGKIPEYKPSRAHCSGTGHKNLHKGKETSIHPHEDRQHFGPVVHRKDGGDEELGHAGGRQTNLGLSAEVPDHDYCGMDPVTSEHNSRLGIQTRAGFVRMETLPFNIPSHLPQVGLPRGRSFRLKGVSSTEQLFQLEARPKLHRSGCLSPTLGSKVPVCFPSILSNCTSLETSAITKCKQDGVGRAIMADTTMVSTSTLNGGRSSCPPPSVSQTSVKPRGTDSPSIGNFISGSSGLAGVRDRLQAEGVSEGASNLILHARRQGSTRTYESAWKKWSLWCHERRMDPFRCHVNACLEYLTDLFHKGHPYRTIGLHRSTISAYHVPVTVGSTLVSVGKHPSISALMSGVHNLRPPKAKYSFTWDVEAVLNLFRSWPQNLDPKRLTLKVTTLLALIGTPRGAELHLFDLNYLADYGDYLSFELAGTIKNGKEGIKPKPIEFHKHIEESKLCPLTCVNQYKALTASWRAEGLPSKFFLSFKAPHKPVTKPTLARWIKETLLLADVDTKTFQAHSLRGASTSKAHLKGLSVKEVIDHGRWSKESTWQKFYHRVVDSAPKRYQDSVLG